MSNKSGSTRNQMTLDLSHSPSLPATFMKRRLKIHDEVASQECNTPCVQRPHCKLEIRWCVTNYQNAKICKATDFEHENLSLGLVLSHKHLFSHREKQSTENCEDVAFDLLFKPQMAHDQHSPPTHYIVCGV